MIKLPLKQILGSFTACVLFSAISHALFITDVVDNDESWTVIAGGWTIGDDSLEPEAGNQFFSALPGGGQARGLYKVFSETFEFGTTLTATFKVGMRDITSRPELATSNAYFFVGSDGNDSDSLITDTRVQVGDTPAIGEWETWTLTTTISDGLETADGTPVTELDQIGFVFRFVGLADGVSQSNFDDLTIVPEPGTYAALVSLGALTLVYLRRRRSKN